MTSTARTATGSYLGRCYTCKTLVRTSEKFVKHECGAWITNYRPIKASETEHECGPRCTSATGPDCECSCVGANHGADHR